jgi:hypothetical protein
MDQLARRQSITYNSIFNHPKKEGKLINTFNNACIYDTKIINYYNNKLIIHDLLTNEIITKDIIINNNIVRKIVVSKNIDYIFILYSEYKNENLHEYIAKINNYNVEIFELNGFIDSIYYYYNNFNKYIILSNTDNRNIYITDLHNNIIDTFNNIFAIDINIVATQQIDPKGHINNNNIILVSDMVSFNPNITNILIFKFDEETRKLIKLKEFKNKSCAVYSNDSEMFYIYDGNQEIIYMYNNLWEIINTTSTKINENSYFYKNHHFNKITLFPNNEYIMLSNFRIAQLWNNKYIGTIDKSIMYHNISHDENYLIAIYDDDYYVWEIHYGKFKMFKILIRENNIYLPDELWKYIENYIIL